MIWCSLIATQDAKPTLALLPFWDNAKYRQLVCPKIAIQCFAGRQIEDSIDVADFAWVRSLLSLMKARSTGLFAPTFRNYDKDLPVENAYDFNLKIFEENRSIAENQKPEIYVWLINRGRFPLGRQFEYISETFEKGEI